MQDASKAALIQCPQGSQALNGQYRFLLFDPEFQVLPFYGQDRFLAETKIEQPSMLETAIRIGPKEERVSKASQPKPAIIVSIAGNSRLHDGSL